MTVRSALRAPVRAAVRAPIILRKRWTPAALFADGQQGVWYEPKPEYLFQDAAGTIPVTADGDPVGLMLDRSRGPELGPELVANADPTAESPNGSIIYDNGAWVFTASGSNAYFSFPLSKTTDISCKAGLSVNVFTGAPRVFLGQYKGTTTGNSGIVDIGNTGQLSFISEGGEQNYLVFLLRDGETLEIQDNISVRELPGNHATQSTSASRPIYRTDGVLHWLEFDGVDDFLSLPLGSSSLNSGFVSLSGISGGLRASAAEALLSKGGTEGGHFLIYAINSSVGGGAIRVYINAGSYDSGADGKDIRELGTTFVGRTYVNGVTRVLVSDGIESYSSDNAQVSSVAEMALGASEGGSSRHWSGGIYGMLLSSEPQETGGLTDSYLASLAGDTL